MWIEEFAAAAVCEIEKNGEDFLAIQHFITAQWSLIRISLMLVIESLNFLFNISFFFWLLSTDVYFLNNNNAIIYLVSYSSVVEDIL